MANISRPRYNNPLIFPFYRQKIQQLNVVSQKDQTSLSTVHIPSPNMMVRGGSLGDAALDLPIVDISKKTIAVIASAARMCLPLIVGTARAVTGLYRTLPKDALIAQVGLVYCFCGGSYPTLFAAVQAARISGLEDVQRSLNDLVEEASNAVEAASKEIEDEAKSVQETLSSTALVVMKSIDPSKINRACTSLYTAWLGVRVVLEKEFANTINHVITLGTYFEPIIDTVVAPPVYLAVPKDYHRWVPITLGWISKAIAMRFAWRLQRISTTGTSAVVGGLMFSRAVMRMIVSWKRDRTKVEKDVETKEAKTRLLDETLGCLIAAAGIYVQLGDGLFDPKVKFPLNLVSWPFDIAEKWIQWQISE